MLWLTQALLAGLAHAHATHRFPRAANDSSSDSLNNAQSPPFYPSPYVYPASLVQTTVPWLTMR